MSREIDSLVDSFTSKLSAAGVPITTANSAAALEAFEAKLGKRLPQSFESLLSRYSFSTFDVSDIELFGWNSDWKSGEYFSSATGPKESLAEILLPAGFLQFGRPATGDFDAICFDMKVSAQNREHRIVRLDHEEILCKRRVKVVGQIAPSFRTFIDRVLSSEEPDIVRPAKQ